MPRKLIASCSEIVRGQLNCIGDYILIDNDGFYSCYKDLCSHQDVKLSDFGELIAGEIVCHAHNGKFNSKDGSPTCLPARQALEKIDIVVIDGNIYLNQT